MSRRRRRSSATATTSRLSARELISVAASSRSATNSSMRALRWSSGARRIDEGCTVAMTDGRPGGGSPTSPRCRVTLKSRPSSDCAAIAPSRTSSGGDEDLDLRPQPGLACDDVRAQRRLVQAALPAHLEAEVLDRVRLVDALVVEARALQRDVQHVAGRPDERVTLDVLAVAGLLADEHELGMLRPLAEDGLRRRAPEVAAAAAVGRLAHTREIACARDEPLGARAA